MRILLTGGTGLIGRALCQYWQRQGHELWVWSLKPNKVAQLCSGAHGISSLQELQGTPVDAVINLAGARLPTALGRLLASKFSGAAALI